MNDYSLTFIGHSLGGGLATAASMATGRDAITFNPATVTNATIKNNGLNDTSKVKNYITIGKTINILVLSITIGGDPLNNTQSKVGLSPHGKTIYVPTNSFNLSHGIDNFLNKPLND